MKNRKIKYEMFINTYNTLGEKITLTKKSFDKMLLNYKKQAEEDKIAECKEDSENSWELDTEIQETEKAVVTKYVVFDNMTSIVLLKTECKDGYCFK